MQESYLSEKEVAVILAQFEQRRDPFRIIIDRVSFWQIMRPGLAIKLQNLHFAKPAIPRKEMLMSSLRGLKFWKLICFTPKKYAVQTFYSGLRIENNGKWDDVWFDSILDQIAGGVKIIRLNAVGFSYKVSKSRVSPTYDTTFFYNLASLLARLFPVKGHDQSFQELSNMANELLGNTHSTPHKVRKHFSHFTWLSRLNQMVLRSYGVKYCLGVGTAEFALIHACREGKIKYVELQHGIFTKDHAYSLPVETLKYESTLLWPSSIALYGDYWKDELSSTAQGKLGILKSVGNGMLEEYQIKKAAEMKFQKELRILVTTHGPEKEGLIRFFKEFLDLTDHPLELVLKLHPSYDPDASAYDELAKADSRVKVFAGSAGENTFSLMAKSHIHLSIASACHFDSLAIGTPTGVLKFTGYEIMEPVIQRGQARLLESPSQLADWIKNLDTSAADDKLGAMFCRPGFKNAVADIISN